MQSSTVKYSHNVTRQRKLRKFSKQHFKNFIEALDHSMFYFL